MTFAAYEELYHNSHRMLEHRWKKLEILPRLMVNLSVDGQRELPLLEASLMFQRRRHRDGETNRPARCSRLITPKQFFAAFANSGSSVACK
ncbi:MAG: hypothetical protein OEM58_13070 [Nitrospirota bacterium]|nr:hypothetical protein [Nitrospirota bacterium]